MERAAAYRSDPEVQSALVDSGVADLHTPTLNSGESVHDLLADAASFENYDPDRAGERGYGFVRLNQLAIEHVLGAR